MSAVGIIFSNLNSNNFSELTMDCTVAAIPFACRYRLVDFCLSNMVNANISNINIVANYNYRSLIDHIGSGKDWDLARRKGGITLISPFQTSKTANSKLYSYHMEALRNMKEYIAEFKEDVVVLMDSDHVMNINLNEVIEKHIKTGADITFVTKPTAKNFQSRHNSMMIGSVAGKVTEIVSASSYTEKATEQMLNIFVMKTQYLQKLLAEAEERDISSLTEMVTRSYKYANYRSYVYRGYVASLSTFLDYYKCSIEIATDKKAREALLWQKEFPIYTRVHNSSPTVYTKDASVQNSMIADDCVIEGCVINSVLSRNVHVAKGAIVKNSVLFEGSYIGQHAQVNAVVADKNVHISDNVTLSGNDNLPIYIEKGRRV